MNEPTTHTPGPWGLHINDGPQHTIYKRTARGIAAGEMGGSRTLAVVRHNAVDDHEANARLMAAAPDLLAALLAIIDNHDHGNIRSEWLDGTDGEPNFDAAREAITKATGGLVAAMSQPCCTFHRTGGDMGLSCGGDGNAKGQQ